MTPTIIYTRSAHWQPLDALIRAWDAGTMSHLGIRLGDVVVDATIPHGVAQWRASDWLQGRVIVDELPVFATDETTAFRAYRKLQARIGQQYDIWEILGFPLLRDLGDPERPVCSRLGYDHLTAACGLRIPGRQGRIGPRLLHAIHHAYNLGMLYGPQPRRAVRAQPC
jgi:hypothetical protein